MEPGIYHDVPFADYQAIDAMSSTRMGWLLDESPYYYKHRIDSGYTFETSATKLGSAAHCASLEPGRFTCEYTMEPDPASFMRTKPTKAEREAGDPGPWPYANPRNSNPYKEAVASLESRGLRVLKQDDYMLACNIAKSIRAHPRVGPLLESAKGTETTLIWKRDGLLCKARLDFWGEGWIADLKSTNDFNGFSPWVVTKYKMHRQAAWYRGGAIECGLNPEVCYPEVCYLAAVSSDVPEVALFALELGALQTGKAELDRGWDLYRACLLTGIWPGRYADDQVHSADISEREYERAESLLNEVA